MSGLLKDWCGVTANIIVPIGGMLLVVFLWTLPTWRRFEREVIGLGEPAPARFNNSGFDRFHQWIDESDFGPVERLFRRYAIGLVGLVPFALSIFSIMFLWDFCLRMELS